MRVEEGDRYKLHTRIVTTATMFTFKFNALHYDISSALLCASGTSGTYRLIELQQELQDL